MRAIIETMNDHNVDTFIALSSPLMGQYGGEWSCIGVSVLCIYTVVHLEKN